jgi:hypothetical protein
MENRSELVPWVIIWAVICALVIRNQWISKVPSAGLPFAYLLNLSMIHWVGGLIYTFPWYIPTSQYLIQSGVSYANVAAGFKESVYGVIGFAIGSVVVAPWLYRNIKLGWLQERPQQPDAKLPKTYLLTGLFFFSVLGPILSTIPGLNAISTAGVALLMVGLCLVSWKTWLARNSRSFILCLVFTCTLPLITVVTMGFIGYGAAATTVVLIFIFNFYRPRWKVVVIGCLVFFLGLSVFVTYLRDRNEIRARVWGGHAFESRIAQAFTTFRDFEIINPLDQQHLEAIDIRLNQNTLIGQAVSYMKHKDIDYLEGETLWQAAIAVVPRFLWPDKPLFAGSGDLVSRYTGVNFAAGTSVGIGQILEFYVNFGTMGVILGFAVFGTVVRIVDITSGHKLKQGNWRGFSTWFLPGIGMLQPGGALAEISASVASSIILILCINKVLKKTVAHGLLSPSSADIDFHPQLPSDKNQ